MRLINIEEVMHTTNLSIQSVLDFIYEGHFPIPMSFEDTKNVYMYSWVDSEINDWVGSVIAQRNRYLENEKIEQKGFNIPEYQRNVEL